jgi:hypothetical protein
MYVPDDEFRKIKEDVQEVRARLDALPKHRGLLEFLGFAAIFSAVVGGAIVLNTRITKTEDAIKVLSSQQNDQTQKLIHELLATATSTDSLNTATKALNVALDLTANLRKEKHPASPEFFQAAIQSLSQNKQPELDPILFKLQTQLAEYRSALKPPLPPDPATITCGSPFHDETLYKPEVPMTNNLKNLTIRDCPQVLDGFAWANVVFINSHIVYKGGPVLLDNVTFINCTFDVVGSNAGPGILKYAALDQKELTFGTLPHETGPKPG